MKEFYWINYPIRINHGYVTVRGMYVPEEGREDELMFLSVTSKGFRQNKYQ